MKIDVEIGRLIGGEELERILIETAREFGLRVKSINETTTKYGLGSVHKERVYDGTYLRLTWKFLPFVEITGIKKGEERSWFTIRNGSYVFPYGFGSEKQIERYLSAVSQRIKQEPQQ